MCVGVGVGVGVHTYGPCPKQIVYALLVQASHSLINIVVCSRTFMRTAVVL